jgi:hypothetical protein
MTNNENMAIAIPENFDSITDEQLMQLTGQGIAIGGDSPSVLSRLSINYQAEDDNDKPLPRGWFSLRVGEKTAYAKTVDFRMFMRVFSYSYWDNAEDTFVGSVQRPSLSDQFPDVQGSYKCGKLTKDELAELNDTDPKKILSNQVKCNQVIYGTVSILEGKYADDSQFEPIENYPCVFYAKGVNYIPFQKVINNLARQKKPMIRTVLSLATKKQKTTGNTFFIVEPTVKTSVDTISNDDKVLLKEFADTVQAVNESVMEKHREAVKLKTNDGDHSLAIDIEAQPA